MEERIGPGVDLLAHSAHQPSGATHMSSFKLLAAIAVVSAAIASPVMAQEVISEPGYCAQFYPYANCQNKGPGNPYTDSNYQRRANQGTWSADETVGVTGKRVRTRRPDSSAMR
jgi:hypothetical protein